ncbi:MAG TPA: sigma-70 family RNA polymerase sigma factor [Polyangiaceae bacterium]
MLRLLRLGSKEQVRDEDHVDPLRALAAAARAGDVRAQRTLLVELGPSLLRTARAVLGAAHPELEDALQDAMTALFLALPGFRGECTTRHFACRVAVQSTLNLRRRSRYRTARAVPNPDAALGEARTSEPSPSESALATQRREILRELLCELPAMQGEVLALHVMLGFTVEETAAAVGAPANTVRSRLRAALATLRRAIQDDATRLQVLREEA